MTQLHVMWLKLGIRQKVAVILVVVFAPLLAAFVIHVALIDHLRSLQAQHHQLVLAREQLHILHRVALDIEDAFRGYVLTRDDLFLEPMQEADTRLQPALDKMADLASSVSKLKNNTPEIRQRLNDLLRSKQELIQRLRDGHPEEVLQYVKSKRGMGLSNDLKIQLRLLEDRLAQRLESTETEQLWAARVAFWGLLGAAAAGFEVGYLGIRLCGG